MANDVDLSFEELVYYRQELQRFCRHHYQSVVAFQDGISFKLVPSEATLAGKLAHPSSTATCIESLLDCPKEYGSGASSPIELAESFSRSAIKTSDDRWFSDGSAQIYCRCRTLPLIVRHLATYNKRVQ